VRLPIYGVDGSSLRVADSPQNSERFGYSNSVRGESAYPLVRMVALVALRSHLIASAAFGPFARGEYSYAEELWKDLPEQSLCIFDRQFFSARLLLRLQDADKNKHWLIRAKARTQMNTSKKLGPGDALVELPVSPEARQKDPSLPLFYSARAIDYQQKGFKPQKLLTHER
jgi:hypothetical protein